MMGLLLFLVKRILWMVPTLLGVSIIMFCLTILIPGDPALLRLGNFATKEQLQQMREEMGLNKPPLERYLLYLKGLVQGDLGRSWRMGDAVTKDLPARFPATLDLGLYSTILSILLGKPLHGVWSVVDVCVSWGGPDRDDDGLYLDGGRHQRPRRALNTRASGVFMGTAVLSIRNLNVHFFSDEGVVRAVDGIDLDMQQGETLGLVGSRGAARE
jgi:ABC-type multidrug transport system fused ATPase/permease subunit